MDRVPPKPRLDRADKPEPQSGVRRRRFRWERWSIPLAILLGLLLVEHVSDLVFTWDDVMDTLGVHDRERYTHVAVLGVVLVTGLLVLRSLQNRLLNRSTRNDPDCEEDR